MENEREGAVSNLLVCVTDIVTFFSKITQPFKLTVTERDVHSLLQDNLARTH